MLIDGVMIAWLVMTAISVVYVFYDAFIVGNPELTVMKWGWVLVTIYIGPVGACLYILACKPPAPGTHAEFTAPLWKQSLGSTIHCLAGDATGFIVAATITVTLGFPVWLDVISEYLFAFIFGLLIFQAVFMRKMLGGSYGEALRRSFMPELLSMNLVMAGMIPVMVLITTNYPSASEVGSLRFLGTLSLATLVGLAAAYPMNIWLVATHQKHGMGTVAAIGKGGHSISAEWQRIRHTIARSNIPAVDDISTDKSSQPDQSTQMEMLAGDGPSMAETSEDNPGKMADMAASVSVTRLQLGAVTVLSLLTLGAGVFIAALFGDLTA